MRYNMSPSSLGILAVFHQVLSYTWMNLET